MYKEIIDAIAVVVVIEGLRQVVVKVVGGRLVVNKNIKAGIVI